MSNNIDTTNLGNGNVYSGGIPKEEHDQIFDLLNLSPTGEFSSNPFETNNIDTNIMPSQTNSAASNTNTFISTPTSYLPNQSHQQQFSQLGDNMFASQSPMSDMNSPYIVQDTSEYQQQNVDPQPHQTLDQLLVQHRHLIPQQQYTQDDFNNIPYTNYRQQQPHSTQYVPLFNFDTPPPEDQSNNFYSHNHTNHSTSNVTVISTHSHVSQMPDPSFDPSELTSNLLSPYETTQYTSTHNSPAVPPTSPLFSTSPYLGQDNGDNDDDNLSIYQTIEALSINGGDHLDLNSKNIKKDFIQLDDHSNFEIPKIVHHRATNELTEDNLNNNNDMLQITSPVTINIQAPEEIAARTPSLFSLSNSQKSTPVNSPRNRSRSSSFGSRERSSLMGSSLLPSFNVQESPDPPQDLRYDRDDDDDRKDLLKPGDEEFQRMRQGRRLSNASRSRSRSRSTSKSADSRKSDALDPTKNREKMIELAAPHSNKRTQKHPSVHACHLCDKTFTRPYNLKSHLRTHTDERPFICGTCGKAFARQHDKKRHEDLHTGEKKFQCKGLLFDGVTEWGCGKRFARADALGRHFKTESGRECVRPLLEDERRRMNQLSSVGENEFGHLKVTDDMLNNFDFNEIFASQMGKE